MILVLISWLVNSFLLSITYLFADILINKHITQPTNWLLFGYLLTTALMVIGISKAGTYLLELYMGCRLPITSEQQKIEPLLLEVIDRVNQTKRTNYTTDQLKIKLVNSQIPDSHALGSDTLLISDGLLRTATDDKIKAVIAHELGHLYNKDSFILSMFIFSSLATRTVIGLHMVVMFCFRWLSIISKKFGKKGPHLMPFIIFVLLMLFLPVIVFSWGANKFFDISLGFMSRQYTYRADMFVKEVGYKDGLVSYLETMHLITNPQSSIWERITAANPPAMKRISKLEKV
ncbi:MAG: family peptidase [Burkholderiales bacterium]|jgi:Zn-dependent protease with chaperone function|nr:family peptidase [Burkholderiales bacterium]